MATRSQTKKARNKATKDFFDMANGRTESKAGAAVRKALTPTKKLKARDKAQRERTVKAARAASDKGRPSNPTDPAARIARRAVKEDEAKKLDQKLDRQGRVQAKRTQRVGERRLKTAGKVGKVGAGLAAVGAVASALSKDDKPKANAKPVKRGPSMKEAGANIRKSQEAFERRRRSNRQAESAMRSVQKSRALGEAAARDPKATKPTPPKAPPTTSVKPPKAGPKVTSGATKPTPPKTRTTPKVVSPPKVTKRPTVTGGGTTMASRNVTREGPMGKRTLANVTREQLTASGLSLNNAGLKKYLDKFDELGRRPKPSDFKKTKEKASKKRTTSRVGSPASGANRRPKPAGKATGGMMKSKMASKGGARGGKRVPPGMMGGGMMKSKMASKGGARGGKKMMMPGGMKNGGMASKGGARGGKKFPDLTGDGRVTQADILKGRGVTKKRNGGMMKSKGMAKGGAMTKKGMAKGGAMKKKGYAKGGMAKKGYSKGGAVRGKPRGVGVALRGYGKALKK
jgi:hypothetical protein